MEEVRPVGVVQRRDGEWADSGPIELMGWFDEGRGERGC